MFDISQLSNHVTANKREFVYRALMEADTVAFLQSNGGFMAGIKNEEQINLFNTTAVVRKAFAGCGRQPLNQTTLGAINLKVHTLQSDEDLCIADLESTYRNQWLSAGSTGYSTVDFIDSITNERADLVALANEYLIWGGDTESTNPDLVHFDGVFKILDAENKAVALPAGDRLYKRLQSALALVPDAIKRHPNFYIMLSHSDLEVIQFEVTGDNYFKGNDPLTDYTLIGSNKRLKPLAGFDVAENDYFVMGIASHIRVGTDLETDGHTVTIKESVETGKLYLDMKWKLGVQVARPEEFYIFKK